MEPSDAAVEAYRRAYWEKSGALGDEAAVRIALEAAYRVDVPRPMVNEDAVGAAITKAVAEYRGYLVFDGLGSVAAAAVMELARPMPTREQVVQVVAEYIDDLDAVPAMGSAADHLERRAVHVADAVLALLNGAES